MILKSLTIIVFISLISVFFPMTVFSTSSPFEEERQKAVQHLKDGNYDDACKIFKNLVMDRRNDPKEVGNDLDKAVLCLQQLNRTHEIDTLIEDAVKLHEDNWRLFWAAARKYRDIEHYGYVIAGDFSRGYHRGGGEYVSSQARDRVRAIQLMHEALLLAKETHDFRDLDDFYLDFAGMVFSFSGEARNWRLQYLTDLSELPDYEDAYYYGSDWIGAPVDEQGNPVYYYTPESFESAKNDGERWRWLLESAMEFNRRNKDQVLSELADFYYSQFGVQTLRDYGSIFQQRDESDETETQSSIFALQTLEEDETIARLANGIKRFKLPEEFNYIKIYRDIGKGPQNSYARQALRNLAYIFENRRQYPKAAQFWRDYGDQNRLKQIIGNWGQFEPVKMQPKDRNATVEYRFRNGTQLHLTAYKIKIETLLNDVKDYLKSNPRHIEWDKTSLANIGYRIVERDEKKYLGAVAAEWDLDLEPREKHFDKRITIDTKLKEPGAYLLTAKMKDGNISRIIIWVSDTTIVEKPGDGNKLYFVVDTVTGEPVQKANVDSSPTAMIMCEVP